MSVYRQQTHSASDDIDLEFWRAPEGVAVPDDDLTFLLVPDAVEAAVVCELAQQVHRYQLAHAHHGKAITTALMAAMGGLLPGILLHDHLGQGAAPGAPPIAFGTIGVSLYKGPNERYDTPRIQQAMSIDVVDQIVLLIDDLGDRGDTLQFLRRHVHASGAKQVLTLALYMKPIATRNCPVDFCFGQVAQDTWIITPRELVETMVQRIPVWKARGASEIECHRRLIDLIGYPPRLVEHYLSDIFTAS